MLVTTNELNKQVDGLWNKVGLGQESLVHVDWIIVGSSGFFPIPASRTKTL